MRHRRVQVPQVFHVLTDTYHEMYNHPSGNRINCENQIYDLRQSPAIFECVKCMSSTTVEFAAVSLRKHRVNSSLSVTVDLVGGLNSSRGVIDTSLCTLLFLKVHVITRTL